MLNFKKQLNKKEKETKDFLVNSLMTCFIKDKKIQKNNLLELQKKATFKRNFDIVSIIVSLLAAFEYKYGARYFKTINTLEDAKQLALKHNSNLAKKINLFCSSMVDLGEENIEKALKSINSSISIECEYDKELNDIISKFKEKNEKSFSQISKTFEPKMFKEDVLLAMMRVGRAMASETDINSLLTIITKQIQNVLLADRCSVFLVDNETNELWSKVALGLEVKEIRFPLSKGLAGHVATTGETINIKNAYENEYFNKEIDIKTGYKTKNILCMPIRNLSHQIVGVFQVLNKAGGNFTKKDEDLLLAIGSSAGIAIENANLFNKQKKLIEEQKELFSSFIDTLSASIDARDKITSGHSKRVTGYATLICDRFDIDTIEKEKIKNASLLHDIGKIGIKDSVLQKEGKLTDEEYAHIKEHVKFTHNILEKVCTTKNFKDVVKIASSHHEKYDGSGYFKGLSKEQIPLGGRILAICDVFDAITSKRHYRSKMEIKEALKIMIEGKGKHFDPDIIEKFLNISLYEILNVMLEDRMLLLNETEKKLFLQFKLRELYAILNKEGNNLSRRENNLIKTFNKYYFM